MTPVDVGKDPAARERLLVERFSVIEDPQERLQALTRRKPGVSVLPEAERTEALLVRGCSSPVWISGAGSSDLLRLRMFSPSLLVYSLAGILCDLCNETEPEAVKSFSPQWLQALRLENFLSSTRQRGLEAVMEAIRHAAT